MDSFTELEGPWMRESKDKTGQEGSNNLGLDQGFSNVKKGEGQRILEGSMRLGRGAKENKEKRNL